MLFRSVRALPPGTAYVINRGRAMKIAVLQAPDLRGELPRENWRGGQQTVPLDTSTSEEVKQLPF